MKVFALLLVGCKGNLHISQHDLQVPFAVETDSSANTVSDCCSHIVAVQFCISAVQSFG